MKFRILAISILALNLTGCSVAIYFKESSEEKTCKPIIEALEKYKKEQGNYPADLPLLSPKYFDKISEKMSEHRIGYSKKEKTYVLTFDYSGGMIGVGHCSYSPGGDWICRGYF